MQQLLESSNKKAEFIEVTSIVEACRDPKDNFLLSLPQNEKATHQLTGGIDLLDLKKQGKTIILTIAEYLEGGRKQDT